MKQYLVVGLGRFGSSVAQTLYKHGKNVLALDITEERVQEAVNSEIVENAIKVDATDEVALKNLGVENFDVAFVCIGADMQSSILVTLVLKELGIEHIIAKALTEGQGKVLQKIGADEVIYPEVYMGRRCALKEIQPTVFEHLRLSDQYILGEFTAPSSFAGKDLANLQLRAKYNINVIAVKNVDGDFNAKPGPETVIDQGDILIAFTDTDAARTLERLA